MERYREYKESGVKWLGEIPSHWELRKMKYTFSERSQKGFPQEPLLASTQTHGVILKSQYENRTVEAIKSLETLKLVEIGDFVISLRSFQGGLEYAYNRGIISPAYTILTPTHIKADYFKYLSKSDIFISLLKSTVTGIREGQNIDYNKLKDNLLPIPSEKEQISIGSYLDSATSEIDKAIAMQQKMIDLLNERKQIIIQNAVTKGLDENVEMKESGVEFVNEIPHNWSTRRLKFSAWIRARLGWKGLKASEYVENGYPFLSAFNIENDHMKWNNLNFINKYRYDESPEIKLKIGDLLLVKDGAGIGKCARIDKLPYGESTANGSLAVITSYDMLDYRYLYYFMVSKSFKDHTELLINGMGVPHFTQGEMKKIVMPVPPQAEQQQIITYLDSKMQRFDTAISNCQRQITLLQERKQIIINEVVTGKVRVS